MPTSGYVAPALYSVGMNERTNRNQAIDALTRLAEGNCEARWRGLAFRRLGCLYGTQDKAKAKECYSRAIEIFQNSLVEQVADVRSDWREMLQARIALIQSDMQSLDGGEGH